MSKLILYGKQGDDMAHAKMIWQIRCLGKQGDKDNEMTKVLDDVTRSVNGGTKAKRSC